MKRLLFIFMVALLLVGTAIADEPQEVKDIKEQIAKARDHTKHQPNFFGTAYTTGAFCSGIGTFKAATKTCVLTGDITTPVVVDEAGATLNCKNNKITGTGTGIGVTVTAAGVTIKKCEISDWEIGILADTDNNLFEKNTVFATPVAGIAADSPADNNLIKNNDITGSAFTALVPNFDIVVIGSGHVVEKNTITGASDNQVLAFGTSGTNTVLKNDFVYSPSRPTVITGAAVNSFSRVTVDDNDFEFGITGILEGVRITNGGGSAVVDNKFIPGPAGCIRTLTGCLGGTATMIRLFNGNYQVEDNKILGSGKSVEGLLGSNIAGSTLRGNTVKDIGSNGLHIANAGGSNVLIIDNTLRRVGDILGSGPTAAILVRLVGAGTTHDIEDNKVTDALGTGIRIEAVGGSLTSSTIQGNTVKRSAANGLTLDATTGTISGVTVTRNILKKNDGIGLKLLDAASNTVTLNDIFNNDVLEVSSDVSVELSDGVRGNYWGLTCPILFREPPLSSPTSNAAGVVDSFPFDFAVAKFVGLPTPTVC